MTQQLPADRFPSSLSVFFPAYNDAPSLPSLIAKTFEVLDGCFADFEVIIINDGSRDSTREVLEHLCLKFCSRLRVIHHPENRGYGGALKSGLTACTKDLIFYTDGDGQYDVAELPKLLSLMRPDVGLVNGYKLGRQDPRHRIWIGHVYNTLARAIFRVGIRDIDCDFRLIRRDLVQAIQLTSTSGAICLELVKKIELSGCAVEEVGVSHYPRLHGRSQFFRVKSLAASLSELTALWLRTVLSHSIALAGRVLQWQFRS